MVRTEDIIFLGVILSRVGVLVGIDLGSAGVSFFGYVDLIL